VVTHIACHRCTHLCPVEDGNGVAAVRCAHCGELVPTHSAPESPEDLREEKARPLSLEGLSYAWVDRRLPSRPRSFLVMVFSLAVGCWLVGLLLATDKWGFLTSREWQVQPFFLAVHFICLRLFVTCYSRYFLAGVRHTDLPIQEARRRVTRLLGPVGAGLAVLIAAPFCVANAMYLFGPKYAEEAAVYGSGSVGVIDWFLWSIWCAEWILNAYIWALLLGFLYLSMRTLRKHRFRAPIEVLLYEKQYRPFLMMSAQGASIVLFFGLVNAFYVWYAEGDLWDMIALGITGLLLLVGFTPPWLQLKASLEREVSEEMFRLQKKLMAGASRRAVTGEEETQAATLEHLRMRLDDALAILRAGYLERMQSEIGRAEGKALLLKLLAPASTFAFKFIRPFLGF
jgi:hypothetical protein